MSEIRDMRVAQKMIRRPPEAHGAQEVAFNRLIRLASTVLGAPIALLVMQEKDKQVVKCCRGLPEPLAPEGRALLVLGACPTVLDRGTPLAIPDVAAAEEWREKRWFRRLGVRAYAGVPLRGGAGEVLGTLCAADSRPRSWGPRELGILQDLADSAAEEISLREALKSVGPMIASVAHEVNNPLHAIGNLAQLLLMETRSEEDREAMEIIEREADRAGKLVSELSRVVRQANGSVTAKELSELSEIFGRRR